MTSPARQWSSNPPTRGFDDWAKELVDEATSLGWVGRLGKRGHIVMRAPDGQTTTTLMPKVNAPRARANQEAPIKRWKRENDIMPETTTKKQAAPSKAAATKDQPFACTAPGCDYVATSANILKGHRLSVHSATQTCPVCHKEFTHPGGFGNHMRAHARAGAVGPGIPVLDDAPKKKATPAKRVPPLKASLKAVEAMPRPSAPTKRVQIIDDLSALNELSIEELQQRIRTGNAAAEVLVRRLEDAEAKIALIRESISI